MAIDRLQREIKRRMEALNLNPLSTAKKAKLGDDAVRDILRGKSENPSHDSLSKIAKALGCTVADLTGEQPRTPIRTNESIVVFEVHTSAQSGPGGAGDIEISRDRSVGEYTFPAVGFRQRFGALPDGVFIDEVGGDSNVPTLNPGQLVMVDSRVRSPYPPGFFLCWDGTGMVLKRLSVIPKSKPPRVQLISDNKQYPAYELPLEEVEIYGRVVGTWTKL
jgi:phage repressor protein C with HTH and peptisase S24 domain